MIFLKKNAKPIAIYFVIGIVNLCLFLIKKQYFIETSYILLFGQFFWIITSYFLCKKLDNAKEIASLKGKYIVLLTFLLEFFIILLVTYLIISIINNNIYYTTLFLNIILLLWVINNIINDFSHIIFLCSIFFTISYTEKKFLQKEMIKFLDLSKPIFP